MVSDAEISCEISSTLSDRLVGKVDLPVHSHSPAIHRWQNPSSDHCSSHFLPRLYGQRITLTRCNQG